MPQFGDVNYNYNMLISQATGVMIINYNRHMFIVQATALEIDCLWYSYELKNQTPSNFWMAPIS